MSQREPTNGELKIMLENMHDNLYKGIIEIHKKQDYTNGQVKVNTEYRLMQQGTISTFKWLFGFLGVGNVVLILKLISEMQL